MLVPGLGAHRVVGELVPVQVELAADETHYGRRHELARSQQSARVAEHAQLQREAQLVAGAPPGPGRSNRGRDPAPEAKLEGLTVVRDLAAESVDEIDQEIAAQRANIKRHGRFIDGGQVRPSVPALERFLKDRIQAVAVLGRLQRDIDVLTSVGRGGGGGPDVPERETGEQIFERLYAGKKSVVPFPRGGGKPRGSA